MNRNADFLPRGALEALGFASLGEDVRIHSTCALINCGAISVGDHVRVDPFVVLSTGEGMTLGRNVHIATHASLIGSARITLCDFTGISQGARILSATDDFSGPYLSGPTVPARYRAVKAAEVVLGRHVIVGAGAVVLPGCRVGDGATVGALSLARAELEAWWVHAGVPTRKIRPRSRDLLEVERRYLSEG